MDGSRGASLYRQDSGGEAHRFYDPAKPGGGGVVGSVIETSRGFAPVAGGGQGAIYEMREREIGIDESGVFNIGSRNELNTAIEQIFGAVG